MPHCLIFIDLHVNMPHLGTRKSLSSVTEAMVHVVSDCSCETASGKVRCRSQMQSTTGAGHGLPCWRAAVRRWAAHILGAMLRT